MKKHIPPTSYIKHLAVSGLSSISARIKVCCNLTGKCFEMPNVSYTRPLVAIGPGQSCVSKKRTKNSLTKISHVYK